MALNRNKVTYSQRPTHATRAAHAKGDKQFRTYDTSYIQPQRRHWGPIVFGIVVAAVVVAVVLALFVFGDQAACTSEQAESQVELAQAGQEVTFVVEEGESCASIAETLVAQKLVAKASDFTDAVTAAGAEAQLKPGVYTTEGGQSPAELVALLVTGPALNMFTVPEGCTIERTAAIVAEAYADTITQEDFIAAAHNAPAYAEDFPFVEGAYNDSLEGFLFPKTYELVQGETADGLVRRMLSQYATEVASLDYTYPEAHGMSAYDVLKLASIVEREADDATAAKVAGVFFNRIEVGMRLQSDATVAYAVGHDPTPEDTQVDSPYNTYAIDGLVPGPICSPGLAALQAVCSPEASSYLYFYFVPREDGSGTDYYFSETYEQHEAAIAGDVEPNG